MTLPQWKKLRAPVPSESAAKRESLALAQVNSDGVVISVSHSGITRWGLTPGIKLPSFVFDTIRSQVAQAGEIYPVRVSSLFLLACRLYKNQGWIIFEKPGQDQEPQTAIFASLIENVPLLLIRARADGQLVYINDGATEITGFSADEVLHDRYLLETVHPEDRWKLTRAMRDVLEGKSIIVALRFQRNMQQKNMRFAEIHLYPARKETGAEIEGVVFDSTHHAPIEDALFLSESLNRSLLEQSSLGVIHMDEIGTVTFESERFRSMIGLESTESWVGESIFDVSGFDEVFEKHLLEMLDSGAELESIKTEVTIGDSSSFLQIHGSAIRHSKNDIVGGVLLFEDITEILIAKKERHRRDAFYDGTAKMREVFFTQTHEITFLDECSRIMAETVSADRLLILLGFPTDDSLKTVSSWPRNTRNSDIFDGVDRKIHTFLASLSRGQTPRFINGVENSSGEETELLDAVGCGQLICVPFQENRRSFGLILVCRDSNSDGWSNQEYQWTTTLVHSFEMLWARLSSERRYFQTVSAINECLFDFSFDTDGNRRYSLLTDQVEKLLGFTAGEILQTSGEQPDLISQLIAPGSREDFAAHNRMLLSTEKNTATFEILDRQGRSRWLRESASPYHGPTGRISVGGILVDVTDQKESERLLLTAKRDAEAANEVKGAFMATMSHEIRTPLGAVNGFADLLARELGEFEDRSGQTLPPQVTEFVSAIRENSRRLLNLVNDLFDLTNLETGSDSVRRISLPLHEVVNRATRSVALQLSQKDVDFRLELVDPEPIVLGDPRRIQQIIENVVENAAKFTERGYVRLATFAPEKGMTRVEIEDTGIGMSDDFLDQLFTGYAQEDRRLNRAYPGTGLGLALVKVLLDRMGGTIHVDSEKGKGSLFTLHFPVATNDG